MSYECLRCIRVLSARYLTFVDFFFADFAFADVTLLLRRWAALARLRRALRARRALLARARARRGLQAPIGTLLRMLVGVVSVVETASSSKLGALK